jgi:RNA polymerase sigma factor (sigma-70 family)
MCVESPQGERGLLESLSRGDDDAFWALWKRHEAHLLAVCARRLQPFRADAEDAVSRSMLLARDKLPTYASEIVDLKAWLTRLTSNVCLDMRKELGRSGARAAVLDETVLARGSRAYADRPSPEACVASAQILAAIGAAIGVLPAPLRAAATLRFVREESYAVIARVLGITEPNARKRVQQARARLLPLLETRGLRRRRQRATGDAATTASRASRTR